MKKLFSLQVVASTLFLLTLTLVSLKLSKGHFQTETFENGLSYEVSYEFDYKKGEADSTFFIKAYLPQSNSRQQIQEQETEEDGFEKFEQGQNTVALWNGDLSDQKEKIQYSFQADVRPVRFDIDPNLEIMDIQFDESAYTEPGAFIESNDPRIIKVADELKGFSNNASHLLTSIFNYVYEIPSQPIKELMTAVEALEINAASCNGKSRLFVALCRSLNIPARVVGGIVLNEEKKKTSHLWAEVLILDEWVPFDPLNGYFAYLPANYLEVYKGDEFLVKRSSDMLFDYNYDIALIENQAGFLEQFNLFSISAKTGVSTSVLSLLLFLPLGSLLVAIFRNVVGLKTFGVFLPVLIAISFLSTGLIFGMVSFAAVLFLISLIHFPLMKWGVLHVPKLVVMLSTVVLVMIIALYFGMRFDIVQISGLTFFPIVILTLSAEKYARIVVEEGFGNATKILVQTLLVTLFCYTVVSSNFIYLVMMNFPELLLVIAMASLMLGKWIGLRISEYKRFGWILS